MRYTGIFIIILLLAGCGGSKELLERQKGEIEYLNAENERLQRVLLDLQQNPSSQKRSQRSQPNPQRTTTQPPPLSSTTQQPVSTPFESLIVGELSVDKHFLKDKPRLNKAGIHAMRGIAERLKRDYPTGRIRVEGYTDSQPIPETLKEQFPSNWELSAARAAMVVRHLQWTHKMDPARFEVVGFGHYAPMTGNNTLQNGSVHIVVLQ